LVNASPEETVRLATRRGEHCREHGPDGAGDNVVVDDLLATALSSSITGEAGNQTARIVSNKDELSAPEDIAAWIKRTAGISGVVSHRNGSTIPRGGRGRARLRRPCRHRCDQGGARSAQTMPRT
jgi:hypothetical protein